MRSLRSEGAWGELERIIYEPAHIIGVSDAYYGTAQALILIPEAEPETPKSPLTLSYNDAVIFGSNGKFIERKNTIYEALHEYLQFVHAKQEDPRTYDLARRKLREAAERLSYPRSLVGHNPRSLQENFWAANMSRSVMPPALRHNEEAPARFNCPAFESGFVNMLAVEMKKMDPRFDEDPKRGLRLVT